MAVPVSDLMTMRGMLHGREVTILKEDGSNSNVISKDIIKKYVYQLDTRDAEVNISHLKKDTGAKETSVVVGATIQIGDHWYTSHWVVSNLRYDILLGMPWHQEMKPKVNNEQRSISVQKISSPLLTHNGSDSEIRVTNLGVKTLRSIWQKRGNRRPFQVLNVQEVTNRLKEGRENILKNTSEGSTQNRKFNAPHEK